MTDNAAAALQPFHVDPVGDVSRDPHEKDQEHADRERETQIVVAVFRPSRPGREGLGADKGNSKGLPKVMLSPESARMMKQVAVVQ